MQKQMEWWIDGIPAPQGSKTAGLNKRTGRATLRESSKKLKPWRRLVAFGVRSGRGVFRHAVVVQLGFYLKRPKADYRANGELRQDAAVLHVKRPDIDKLERAVLDSLTDAGVIRDDSFVVDCHSQKWYELETDGSHKTGVKIHVEELTLSHDRPN